MRPVLHRILVKKDPVEKKTEGGIILALNERSEKKATVMGTVVEVGSTAFISFGSTPAAEGIVPGVRVYFSKFARADIGEDTDLTILNDEDIIGVV